MLAELVDVPTLVVAQAARHDDPVDARVHQMADGTVLTRANPAPTLEW